jgi:hypothetical protein
MKCDIYVVPPLIKISGSVTGGKVIMLISGGTWGNTGGAKNNTPFFL